MSRSVPQVHASSAGRVIGKAIRRPGAPRFLRGEARFLADINLPETLHAAFLRSPHAHARILSIDTSAALALPGVHAVLTGFDVADTLGGLRVPNVVPIQRQEYCVLLPTDKARYVGEPLAIVVADDRYLAEDALEL